MRPRRVIAVAAVVVALIATAVVVFGSVGNGHVIKARLAAALDIAPGQEVRVAGSRVGKVTKVEAEHDGALVTLRITDDRVWPLPASSRIKLRWGSTTAYLGRFVQIVPGPQHGPLLSDGATLAGASTTAPVEFDQVYTIFNRKTRPRVQKVIAQLAETVDGREQAIGRALHNAPGGVGAAADILDELSRDRLALSTLVRTGAKATEAIAREDPALRDLVTHAAATFDTFAAQSRPVQEALERVPGTLTRARAGLARVSRSLPGLTGLVDDIRPAATELRATAPILGTTAERLSTTAPTATRALRVATSAAPVINRLLAQGIPFFGETSRALTSASPVTACIRPYGPEIAGFAATWAGFSARYDATGHYARALPPVQPIPNGTTSNSIQSLKANPAIKYAMPRPPGLNVRQPWFQPQCGAGPDALDVNKDPQATDPGADRG